MNTVELIIYTDLKCSCMTPKIFSPKYISSLPKQLAIFNNDDGCTLLISVYFKLFPYGNSPILFLYRSSEVNLMEASKFCRKKQFIGLSNVARTEIKKGWYSQKLLLFANLISCLCQPQFGHSSDLDKSDFENI